MHWFTLGVLLFISTTVNAKDLCPIEMELDSKLQILSNATLLMLNPQWKDPAQVSGFTKTDFSSIKPWQVSRCGANYCAKPKKVKLVNHIFVRPQKLDDETDNPRWLAPDLFPCGSRPNKNYVTYSCTVEHEKVHVVQREEAIQNTCPVFLKELSRIHVTSEEEAEKLAQQAYAKLVDSISLADQEDIPYQIEWKCNSKLAEKAGVQCSSTPVWSKLKFLDAFSQNKGSHGEINFEKDGVVYFTANFIEDTCRLSSLKEHDGCLKMQWYFSAGILDQENCFNADGSISKTFYEFGKKQRSIVIDSSGKKISENIFFNPKERILKD